MTKPVIDHIVKVVSIDTRLEQNIKTVCDAQLASGYNLVNTCCYYARGGPSWIMLVFKNG